jgi:hypothetical protein
MEMEDCVGCISGERERPKLPADYFSYHHALVIESCHGDTRRERERFKG